jgi:ABC-2 type transport system permease protein
MRNILLVIKHEITTVLQKRSFWITAFLLPVLMLGLNIGVPLLAGRLVEDNLTPLSPTENIGLSNPVGYVDQAGLIKELPADVPKDLLKAFPNEAAAQLAAASQEIAEYVIIPGDYLQTGTLIIVQRDFRPWSSAPRDMFKYIIDANLTGDAALAALLSQPTRNVEMQSLAPQSAGAPSGALASLVPLAVLSIFYFLLMMSTGFMLQSVSREKENRTVEILLLSLHPRELMLGKIIGLSVVALLQIIVWIGGALVALTRGRVLLTTMTAFVPPAGIVVWALLYFLLGYLLYASLMGAIGALAPSAREGGAFTVLVLLPLMIPLLVSSSLVHSPNGPLAMALSLFPFTSPSAMITRLVATQVPIWQTLVSLAGLVAATAFCVVLSARFFQADTLLSHSTINWQRILIALQRKSVDS